MLFRQAKSTKAQRVAQYVENRKLRQRYGFQRSLRVEGQENRRLLASGPILDYALAMGNPPLKAGRLVAILRTT